MSGWLRLVLVLLLPFAALPWPAVAADPPDINLFLSLYRDGRYPDALVVGRRLIAACDNGALPADTCRSVRGPVIKLVFRNGGTAEAIALQRTVVAETRAALGDAHDDTLSATLNLATYLEEADGYDEAERLYSAVIATAGSVSNQRQQARANIEYSNLLTALGRVREAAAPARLGVALLVALEGADADRTLSAKNNLGLVMDALGRDAEAMALYKEVLDGDERRYPPGHVNRAAANCNYGGKLLDRGRAADAHDHINSCFDSYFKLYGRNNPATIQAFSMLSDVVAQIDGATRAAEFYLVLLKASEETYGLDHSQTAAILDRLSANQLAQGKPAQALGYARRSLAVYERLFPDSHPRTIAALAAVGRLELWGTEDFPAALARFRRVGQGVIARLSLAGQRADGSAEISGRRDMFRAHVEAGWMTAHPAGG